MAKKKNSLLLKNLVVSAHAKAASAHAEAASAHAQAATAHAQAITAHAQSDADDLRDTIYSDVSNLAAQSVTYPKFKNTLISDLLKDQQSLQTLAGDMTDLLGALGSKHKISPHDISDDMTMSGLVELVNSKLP